MGNGGQKRRPASASPERVTKRGEAASRRRESAGAETGGWIY